MRRPLAALVLLAPVAACGSGGSGESEIVVFAAASLTAAFEDLGAAFTAAHPELHVVFNFGASSELAAQILQGAPADVFASADEPNMDRVVDGDTPFDEPRVFATNALQIVVEPGNPERIDDLADLGREGILYVTCAPEVPIGRYAADALAKAGVTVEPASFEENVKSIVTKVTAGEADAGIVYRTDVIAAGSAAEGVEIPADLNVVARYPIAAATGAAAAAEFVSFVLGDAGQSILAAHGFGSAP